MDSTEENMKIETEIKKTLAFDPTRVEQCYEELVEVFRKHRLGVGEILIAYGNLGYTLGASIEGYKGKGPSPDDLKRLYYSKPSPGVALMLQGITVTTWYDQYAQTKVGNDEDKQGDSTK